MNAEEHLKKYGLVPEDPELPAIRAILDQELEDIGNDGGTENLALLCCVQLFSKGQLEDVRRIWAAKNADFDMACMVEAHLLCGAGVEVTKEYLKAQSDPDLHEALANIEAWGDELDNFDPGKHLEFYHRYFQPHRETVSQATVIQPYRSTGRRFIDYCIGLVR